MARAWRAKADPGPVPWWEFQDGWRPSDWSDAKEVEWRGEAAEKSNASKAQQPEDPLEAVPVLLPATVEAERPEIEVASLAEFSAVEEPGAAALVGETDSALVPEGGDVMFYGDGGAGKTTLAIDLAFHLAAGNDWLGIPVPQPVRILLIENEGPRPLFRAKLRRKLAGWTGSPIADRITVLEAPWAELSLSDIHWRETLAATVQAGEIDVLIAGPVTRLGMDEAGTLQEVRDFAALVDDVRRRSGRQLAWVLVHHENRAGKVSGAWEAAGDTLLHVTAQGHGKTRLHIQKARWASPYHATTLHLRWAEGEGFAVEDQPELDDETIAERLLRAISEDPGTGWTRLVEATPGMRDKRRRAVRDGLLRDGRIANVVKAENGELVRIDHCPERRPARLYLADDPTISHLRPDPAADGPQTAAASGGGGVDASAALRPALKGPQAVAADDPPPQTDLLDDGSEGIG